MLAHHLVQYLSWAVYLVLCGITLVQAIRRPVRVRVDTALLFSSPALIIVLSLLIQGQVLPSSRVLTVLTTTLLLSLGYLLLRLADDFAGVPDWLMWAASCGLGLSAVTLLVMPAPLPAPIGLALGVYLVGLLVYAGARFIRVAGTSGGLTQRRMRAVATGTFLMALLFVLAILSPLVPDSAASGWQIVQDGVGLATGLSFFIGFAPPAALRRAWQEPELRAFLARAVELPRLPDRAAIVAALEQGAMKSIGAQGATIGLWDPSDGLLHFSIDPATGLEPNAPSPGAHAFRTQRAVFTDDVPRDYPIFAAQSRQFQATAVLVAPITAGQQRLGILTVFAPRAPIFAEDDLALVQLLADQAAVILESRALIDAEARVQAREEIARLKEEFLATAAHDLKTPLTTVLARAQLMERRAMRDPQAPADLTSIQILVRETRRLQRLVLELLDASRAEHGQLIGEQNTVDLTSLAQMVCARHTSGLHTCEVEAGEPIVGVYDDVRLEQVLDNLVENAVKYSPHGSPVHVRLWRQEQEVLLTVSDSGIGIPDADLPHVFERFYRSANADDRHFPGLGLGLYICRTIVEQHGGRIWVTSDLGQGTTFHIALPYVPAPVAEHAG